MPAGATDQTTLAFVRTVDGEPHYAFYDEGTASRNWTYHRGSIAFDDVEAVHVGSTTLVHEKSAAETLAMVEEARGSATISFDPNCRPNLVVDKTRYVTRMRAIVAAADIVRMSDVDFEFLYGGMDYADRAQALIAAGVGLVVVTRGARGAQAWHGKAGLIEVEAPRSRSSTRSGRATAFRRRCCSPCAPSDGSRSTRLRRPMPTNSAAPCRLPHPARRSRAVAPAPSRHGRPTSARSCSGLLRADQARGGLPADQVGATGRFVPSSSKLLIL